MAEKKKKPLLELDTLVEPQFVRIDGQNYEVRPLASLTVLEDHKLRKNAGLVGEIGENASDEDVARVGEILDETCRAIVRGVPNDVFARLTVSQKIAILGAFSSLLPARTPAPTAGETVPEPTPSTGGR